MIHLISEDFFFPTTVLTLEGLPILSPYLIKTSLPERERKADLQ